MNDDDASKHQNRGAVSSVHARDFAPVASASAEKEDIEAHPRIVKRLGRKISRSISFQEHPYSPQNTRRRGRNRSSSIASTAATSEGDSVDLNDSDTEDVGDDDGRSTIMTEASDLSEEEQTDRQRRRRRRRRDTFTPGFIARGRERRRRRRRRQETTDAQSGEEGDDEVKSTKVYRRTPVLSGVIAPFSIMLEIPGFTSRWYVRLDPNQEATYYRPNPIILDVGLAFSLASAIIANLSILGRFAERIPPRKATLVAGLFFIIHDVINAVALISFGVIHAVDDGFTYSEAYWMTTAATGASLICTLSLILDYVKTKDFKNAGSGLTPKQAQLVMVIMAFLAYISISAMIFALIMPLPFLDSMYFMVESLATVGLGDITPTNLGSRIALFFVAPGGIILLAVVVAISRQTIIEEFENAYKRRRALYKQKAAERQEERRKNKHMRFKMLRRGSGRGGTALSMSGSRETPFITPQMTLDSVTDSIAPFSQTATATAPAKTSSGNRWYGGSWSHGFSRRAANQHNPPTVPDSKVNGAMILDEKDRIQSSPISSNVDLPSTIGGEFALHRTDTTLTTTDQLREYETMLVTQRQEIEQNFAKFRKELAKAERNEFWVKLGVAAALFACFWLVGGAIFCLIEGWTYFQGFYFVFVVFTSIGYGDLSPKSSGGRAFFIVWGLLGVGTLTILFSVVSDAWANRVQQRKLAGEKVKKESKMSRLLRKVKGNRGGHKEGGGEGSGGGGGKSQSEVKAEDRVETPTQQSRPGKSSEKGSAESIIASSAGKGGILLDTSKESPSRTESVIAAAAEKEEEEENQDEAEPKDITQLHMDFTTTAMEFHKSALDFMRLNRSNVVDTFRHVPEMREIARKVSEHADGKRKQRISEHDRKRLLDAVEGLSDHTAMQSTKQWLLIQDFEHMLHSLVNKSSTLQGKMARRDTMLQEAQEQVRSLNAQLPPAQSS